MEEFLTPMYAVVLWGCSLESAEAWLRTEKDATAYAAVLNKYREPHDYRVALVATRMIVSIPVYIPVIT